MNTDWQFDFVKDPSRFPHLADLQKDQILLSTMNETDFRRASFLDQRLFTPELQRQVVSWTEISALSLPPLAKPHYIFHIGHVGSTLISRLLGELDSVFALREPALLRQLAEIWVSGSVQTGWSREDLTGRLEQVEAWLSRVFHSGQRAMIKASSFVSPLARPLLANNGTALFLFAALDRYLPTILAGDASQQEAAALADIRLYRLEQHCGLALATKQGLSLAQTAALGWLCEMVTLCDAEAHCPDAAIVWMDFEAFLKAPAGQLQRVANHFGTELSVDRAKKLTSGPIMRSYSKAPEHDYSPSLRAQLIAEATQIHSDDIRQTLLWVEQLAGRLPKVAAALKQAETKQ